MTGRRGRRRRKLLDDLKDMRGYSHSKEEALNRTVWRAVFGRGFGPVVRQTTKRMNVSGDTLAPMFENCYGRSYATALIIAMLGPQVDVT